MEERLESIRALMRRRNVSVYYAWPDAKAEFFMATRDGTDDVLWMVAEIEKLRLEVNDLSSPRAAPALPAAPPPPPARRGRSRRRSPSA